MSLENHRKTSFSGGLIFTGPFLNRFFSEGLSKRPDSLRSWRYCVGAKLKFWRRSRVPEKGSRDEAVEFLAASPLVTAPPSNLTRLLHNSASYAGWPPDDWPENQPILPCNFRSVSTWVLRLSFTRYGWLWGSSCFMIRMRKRGSYNLAYLIEHKTQYLQPVSKHRIEKRVEKLLEFRMDIGWNTVTGIKYYFSNEQWFLKESQSRESS